MNRRWPLLPWLRRLACAAALAAAALLLGAAACSLAGLRINTSPSIPLGVYRMSGQPVVRGSHVLLCPPQTPVFALALQRGYLGAGFCPGGYGYLMKRVSAAEADHVRFAADGVRVNGRLLAASAALPVDQAGRRLPPHAPGALTLGPDQLLLMSARRTAWDARYFGPVARAQIESVIVPLLTWPWPRTCSSADSILSLVPPAIGPEQSICGSARGDARAVSANHGDSRHQHHRHRHRPLGVIDMTRPKSPLPFEPGRRTAAELEAIVREKFIDANTPGFIVEFDPEEAEYAGAFIEDALSEEDALASVYDPRNDGA